MANRVGANVVSLKRIDELVNNRLYKDEKFANKVLLLSVLNPMNYLLIYWAYTATYCLPLMSGCTYLGILLFNDKHK